MTKPAKVLALYEDQWIRPGRSIGDERSLWGGKAVHLQTLLHLGATVPDFLALSAEAFTALLKTSKEWKKVKAILGKLEEGSDLKGASAQLRELIEALPWNETFEKALLDAFDKQFPSQPFVAVRSSARDEDSEDHSFAGLHDSLLFVRRDGLLAAIRKVWSSAFSERALGYRLRGGLDVEEIGIAVVIQEMIDPVASGVVFSVDPTDEDLEVVLINALWGAGEGLVGAGFEADQFRVQKRSGEIEKEVAKKTVQLLFDSQKGAGLAEVAVPPNQQEIFCLSDDQIREITAVATRMERHFRRPQDLEFCVDQKGTIRWVQTRAITTLKERGPAAGERLIWDNSNIIESYSGVTTPLTFSFIEGAYTIVYQCFSEVMGIPQETVRRNMPVFRNMLGLVRGEVYYNLLNWYRVIRLFPGFNLNKEFMESMMGVDESLMVDDVELQDGLFEKAADFKALTGLILRTLRNFQKIEGIANEFEEHFEEHFQVWAKLDLNEMTPDELMKLYWEMEEKLLWNWRAPIINDFYVMIAYGLLAKLCAQWCGDDEGTLQHDLICGEGGIATKEASDELIRLAKTARKWPAVKELIQEVSKEEVLGRLKDVEGGSELQAQLDQYLEEYGYRSMNELKLEEPTMRDNPAFVFQMIRNYLNADESVLDLEARRERELAIRHEAEARAFGALKMAQKPLFKKVLRAARRGVKNRENMRFKRTKIYGLAREVFLATADNFVREQLLQDRDDIFYLTVEEIWAFVKGTAVTTNLKGLVALRKEEFQGYKDAPEKSPHDRFATYGTVYHGNAFERRRKQKIELEEGQLAGIGCCSGIVEGPVKVIRTPGDDMSLNGEILVAERTDPGWVPLYPSVSAVLIERGSVLSHSAIVAREMGIPTIVGVEGLLNALKTGDVVRMDGKTGIIEILSTQEP